MRVTTAFKRLLRLDGIHIADVFFGVTMIVVTISLARKKLVCPLCSFSTRARYDKRPVSSRWRHLDLGVWRLELHAELRRLECPEHGVRTESVPFGGHGSRFTADFEDLVAWCATKMDKKSICRLLRIDWDTVGRICERVCTDLLDESRLDDLFEIGVDEISWKKHHNYITLVTDHNTRKVVWGKAGKNAKTLDAFFKELGEPRSGAIEAVSMDMGAAYNKSVGTNAPNAVICIDPFHVVKLGGDALEAVRRDIWQQLRRIGDSTITKKYRGHRWALLKNPEDLTDRQATALKAVKKTGGALWRGYQLKESLRAIFAGDLTENEASELIGRWCSRASRSRLKPFVKTAKTIRKHKDGILASIRHRLSNGLHEGLNNKVRLIIRRAYGFHSAEAALSLVMLSCGSIELTLPHEQT
jgi:transposase